jgi:hypothetical protein
MVILLDHHDRLCHAYFFLWVKNAACGICGLLYTGCNYGDFYSTSSRLQCRTKTKLAFAEPYVFSFPSRPPSEADILSRRTKHVLDQCGVSNFTDAIGIKPGYPVFESLAGFAGILGSDIIPVRTYVGFTVSSVDSEELHTIA